MQTTQSYNRMVDVLGEPEGDAWRVCFSDGSSALIHKPEGSDVGDWERLQYSLREWDMTGNIERADLVISNRWNIYEVNGYWDVLVELEAALRDGIDYAKRSIDDGDDKLATARALFDSMDIVLNSYDGFGASDSEPRNYLANCINQEFDVIING